MNLEPTLQAIVDYLEGQGWPATLDYRPAVDITTAPALQVLVAPGYLDDRTPLEEEPVARTVVRHTLRAAVALIASVTADNRVHDRNQQLDQLRQALRRRSMAGASWVRQELIAAPSPDHLRNHNLYMGIFHVEYRMNGQP